MLQRGDLVPHFDVMRVDGASIRYSTIWQHRNLVLITLPAEDSAASGQYVSQLTARLPEFDERATTCVITRSKVEGLPAPGVVVADRWGEIVHVAAEPKIERFPAPDELLDWVDYIQRQCPECEGEAR